ncbi:PREDICTED: high-affinity nitrate transporter 3.1-like [Fragaria vesca subsp. vesca]|uniref:high-affinity nitrate transporter 3.1-like n=1 Tax=Fragaria vesca subsp. vesca TaxID=101020 RepID=UPI0002C32B00|nr:PREDICTED: high-affinity nitrate transporter 3.1-like [Fragaria vesca subsp. vesca]
MGTDTAYKTVNLKLCYAPVSQVGKPERKTEDDLDKDKTCQIEFYTGPYNSSSNWQFYESTLDRHVPIGSYFVRAYVTDSAGVLVAYGQSTGQEKDYNIFEVSGSHKRLEMVSIIWFRHIAYVYDGAGVAVAYGQSTNAKKDLNIFDVQGITGRHKRLDVVSICFSVFSVLSLVGFFAIEKTRAKSSHHK